MSVITRTWACLCTDFVFFQFHRGQLGDFLSYFSEYKVCPMMSVSSARTGPATFFLWFCHSLDIFLCPLESCQTGHSLGGFSLDLVISLKLGLVHWHFSNIVWRMMNGISKAIALYLAPVLALTATVLSLLAFLAPTLLLHDRVALVTVFPSTELSKPGSTQSVDGPSVFLGSLGKWILSLCYFREVEFWMVILGSCARPNNDAPVDCTFPSVSPQFGESAVRFRMTMNRC